jgi:hypothetical protein
MIVASILLVAKYAVSPTIDFSLVILPLMTLAGAYCIMLVQMSDSRRHILGFLTLIVSLPEIASFFILLVLISGTTS